MASVQIFILLRPYEYNCLYFCCHLYEAYIDKSMVQQLTCVEDDSEVLLYCDCCFKEKIVKYITFKHWSKEFFDNFKKNLIQYFVKADEFDGIFRLR